MAFAPRALDPYPEDQYFCYAHIHNALAYFAHNRTRYFEFKIPVLREWREKWAEPLVRDSKLWKEMGIMGFMFAPLESRDQDETHAGWRRNVRALSAYQISRTEIWNPARESHVAHHALNSAAVHARKAPAYLSELAPEGHAPICYVDALIAARLIREFQRWSAAGSPEGKTDSGLDFEQRLDNLPIWPPVHANQVPTLPHEHVSVSLRWFTAAVAGLACAEWPSKSTQISYTDDPDRFSCVIIRDAPRSNFYSRVSDVASRYEPQPRFPLLVRLDADRLDVRIPLGLCIAQIYDYYQTVETKTLMLLSNGDPGLLAQRQKAQSETASAPVFGTGA